MKPPLSENMTTMVNSNAISVSGLIRGINRVSYHSRPFALQQHEPRQHPGKERNAQVDHHAFANRRDA